MKKCLMIAGMHRSGTSLISSVLQKAGLFIGDELMAAGEGNEKGHFENIDFYNFQVKVLESLSLDTDGWDLKTIETLNEEFDKEAMDIIQRNNKEEWGWKEPRTTLFLKYWENKIPNMKYLFVYRDPWDVVDSLYRRGSDPKIMADAQLAFKVWDFYNREIISAYKKHKENSILIHIDDLIKDIPGVIKEINARFGFNLKPEKVGNIFDQSIYKSSDETSLYSWHTAHAFPEIIDTLNELRVLNGKEKYQLEKISRDKIVEKMVSEFISNWHQSSVQDQRIRNLKVELKNREEEIKHMKSTVFWRFRELLKNIKNKLF
jgi:hypothetical protein